MRKVIDFFNYKWPKDETIENEIFKSIFVKNVNVPESAYDEDSIMSRSHNHFEGVSIDFSKAPNMIYIDQFNDESIRDQLGDVGLKVVESLCDLSFEIATQFGNNLRGLFVFLMFNIFYHLFAGKF